MGKILKILMLYIVINSSYHSYSQIWPKFYGEPGRLDYCYDVIETYDNGFVILGGYNYDWSWIIKTSINGDVLWDKVIECNGKSMFFATAETFDGGFIMAGRASLFENITDPVIVKINGCGEKEWCKVFRTPDHLDFAYDVVALEDGSSIVLTIYNSFIPGEDVHLYKLDSEGNVLWKNAYATSELHPDLHYPIAYDLIRTNDMGYIISGSCYYPEQNNPNIIALRPMFIKVNSLGTEEWLLPFGINNLIFGEAASAIEFNENKYIGFAGKRNDPDPVTPILIMINENGTVSSFKEFINDTLFNNYEDAYFYNGLLKIDKLIVTLNHNHEPATSSLFGLITTDTLLNLYQAREIDTAKYPFSLEKTIDFKLLNTAKSNEFPPYNSTDIIMFKLNEQLNYDTLYPGNYTYDSLCTTPGLPQSGFIYLDDCDIITSYEEIPSPEEYYAFFATIPINAYPNPAETEITLAFQNTEHHSIMLLECYNIYGQKLHSEKIWKGQQQTKLDVNGWNNGLYFVVIKSEGKVAGTGRFVKR